MRIVRWQPFSESVALRAAMDRMFEDSVARPWPALSNVTVPVDVVESENEVVVKAALPGIKPEEVEVTLHGECLTIKGEAKGEQETKKEHYLYRERHYGAFCRQITVPESVRGSEASASYENGVLTVTLPKTEEAKPKQIKIQGTETK